MKIIHETIPEQENGGRNDIKKITRRQGFADLIATTPRPSLLQTVAGYPITVPPELAATLSPAMTSSSEKGKGAI